MNLNHEGMANQLAELFKAFPQVEAVALGGSRTSGVAVDPASDIDLYVFTTALIPLEARVALVEQAGGASRADMNLNYWDLGDEWFHKPTGIEVDMMYWDTRWMEETLDRVLVKHQPSIGYSTAHWRTVRDARVLFDRQGWFARLQARARGPYPEPLRRAIIKTNYSLMRAVIPAYQHQIEKAVQRGDLNSVNHRVAALLASYFDIIFAVNRALHPGEKRLLEFAARLCPSLPEDMAGQVTAVLRSAGAADEMIIRDVSVLLDMLDEWLEDEGCLP